MIFGFFNSFSFSLRCFHCTIFAMCLIKGGVINSSYNNGHNNLFYFQEACIGANLLSIICVSAVISSL